MFFPCVSFLLLLLTRQCSLSLSLSLSFSQIPSFLPRADEEWVELLRDMDVERSGAVDRAAWCAYLSALGSQGETQMGDLIAELQMVRWEARRHMEAAHS